MTEIGLYDRDGHLLGLTVERLLVGELSERDLSGHLGGCAPCRERVARARAIAPPPLPAALMAAARAAPALSAPAASPPAAPRATAADLWRVFLRWITPAGLVAAVAAGARRAPETPGARGGGCGGLVLQGLRRDGLQRVHPARGGGPAAILRGDRLTG